MAKMRRIVALTLSLSVALTMAVTTVSAYTSDIYSKYAPDDIMAVDDSILSGATAAASTVTLSILGIDVTSTDLSGVFGAGRDTENPVNLLVFGSKANENPDPYLWNFYYNFNKYGGTIPADPYDITAYADWEGSYTLLNNAKKGLCGGATDTYSIPINVNGIFKVCNPLFFYEPDVLFGGNDGFYDVGLKYYQDTVNADYNPLELYGWTSGGYASKANGFEFTAAMANGVYALGKKIDKSGTEKVSRYNNGDVLQCGIDYSNFALGVYYYVQSRLNPSNSLVSSIPMAGYCTGISISDSGEITVTNDNSPGNRYEQYLDGIAYQVPTGTVYQDYGKLKDEVRLIIMDTSQLTDSQKRMLTQVNVKYVDFGSIMPQTAYGTILQSADNILGVPYFVGLLYEGKLSNNKESLSEYDYTAYFIENLYHVNNGDVETVLDAMVGDGCGSGYTGLDRSYNYNDLINSMIRIGAVYYEQTSMGSGNWLAIDEGDFYVDYEEVN